MSGENLTKLDTIFLTLKENQGFDVLLDEKLVAILKNRDIIESRIRKMASSNLQFERVLGKLVYLIERFHTYRTNSTHMKARSYLQDVVIELVSTFPSCPNPLILLSEENRILDLPLANKNDYIIEASYLKANSIAGCAGINHEIGHCMFKEYFIQDGKSDQFLEIFNPPLEKQLRKLKLKVPLEYIATWIFNWVSEFVADAFSVLTLGMGGFVRFIKDSQNQGIPMYLGKYTHPPNNLRLQLMKDRLMMYSDDLDHNDASFQIVNNWKTQGRYQMPTSVYLKSALNDPQFDRDAIQSFIDKGETTSIPNKLAFDRKLLKTIYSYIDAVLDWGRIRPNFNSIQSAVEELKKNNITKAQKNTIFAALIDITKGEYNASLEELLQSY